MPRYFVATDLSDRGDRAVHRAILMAASMDAELTVLTVVDDALPVAIAAQVAEAAELELSRIVASFPEAAKAQVSINVVTGDPARTVAERATEARADLLILGRHRERPFGDLFRQTTAQRIITLVTCPVLLVSATPAAPYKHVLHAIDFSPASAAVAQAALSLAPKARHEGLHVYHVPFRGLVPGDQLPAFLHEAEDAEADWRTRFGIGADTLSIRLLEGGVQSELTQAVAKGKPDLVAVGAHGRSAISRAVLGSVTTMLMCEPPCDLLIARPGPARIG
ncbi:universal stress protein [Defluviimonas sp. WL0050]|uniref:Universal stress protein n=1 Tax=Albidovulum litorale TaxID=2984134 RepID=A0ABT2ZIM7_9RHOB|nr:universal stress protein [Defluviimonas sp. WL0050]MCV2870988.1 universal stress protein [Defluviimonas sp. WL0050]